MDDVAKSLISNVEFISDMARYMEEIYTEKFIRRKYGNLTDNEWLALGESDELVSAIELERARRVRDGSSAREQAQQLYAQKVPTVLGTILNDTGQPARSRIESARELRMVAGSGSDAALENDRVIIKIDLSAGGGEVIEGNAEKRSPVIDAEMLPMIAANKRRDGGGSGGEAR